MARYSIRLLVAIFAVVLLVGAVRADDGDDLKSLQGKWKPIEANLGDNKIDQEVLDKATVEFADDKYTVTIGEMIEKGAILLDPKKAPKQMDIFPTQGANNGKTLWAIYQLEADSLTVCYSLTPGVRPENFDPDTNTLLYVKYQRVKDE
ncbi:MAG: TIGR03067 domain-containing protein [Pirellulaceae bacterium]|nr:TIGR03067 domain-containing protein [Pirellulaceae bacterium]